MFCTSRILYGFESWARIRMQLSVYGVWLKGGGKKASSSPHPFDQTFKLLWGFSFKDLMFLFFIIFSIFLIVAYGLLRWVLVSSITKADNPKHTSTRLFRRYLEHNTCFCQPLLPNSTPAQPLFLLWARRRLENRWGPIHGYFIFKKCQNYVWC